MNKTGLPGGGAAPLQHWLMASALAADAQPPPARAPGGASPPPFVRGASPVSVSILIFVPKVQLILMLPGHQRVYSAASAPFKAPSAPCKAPHAA